MFIYTTRHQQTIIVYPCKTLHKTRQEIATLPRVYFYDKKLVRFRKEPFNVKLAKSDIRSPQKL